MVMKGSFISRLSLTELYDGYIWLIGRSDHVIQPSAAQVEIYLPLIEAEMRERGVR